MLRLEMTPKYQHIKVKLLGKDGNAFFILGQVRRALRENNVPREEINKFTEEATSEDYSHLLNVVMKYVIIE